MARSSSGAGSKLRISLSEDNGAIRGEINLPADGTFVFEAMQMVFDEFCKTNGYKREDVYAHFYRFCVYGVKGGT